MWLAKGQGPSGPAGAGGPVPAVAVQIWVGTNCSQGCLIMGPNGLCQVWHRWVTAHLLERPLCQGRAHSAPQPGLFVRLSPSALRLDRESVMASPHSWRPGKRM